ncbi:MAG: energy transducer TonB [Gammaproteobacteria bacterium]|nr:energy transducer TonB [Gammaproteobacteria bacterium]
MLPTMDMELAEVVEFGIPAHLNRARLPVWCGASLLGSIFTVLWFIALTHILMGARPVDVAAPQELELVAQAPPEVPQPPVLPPVQPKPPAPKTAVSKPSEPVQQPQPMMAPTTNETSPLPPEPTEPPPMTPNTEAAPAAAVETVVAPAPIKVEPLFRLTRLPDFGNATTLKYPAAEKNRGREGKVIAEFVIDLKGAVRDIKILKSAGTLFDQAVIDELGKMTFSPPYIGERAVAARFRREFQFKLD